MTTVIFAHIEKGALDFLANMREMHWSSILRAKPSIVSKKIQQPYIFRQTG